MEKDQGSVCLGIGFKEEIVRIEALSVRFEEDGVVFQGQKCMIKLPVRNIAMVAKNKLDLILLVKDPDRKEIQEVW